MAAVTCCVLTAKSKQKSRKGWLELKRQNRRLAELQGLWPMLWVCGLNLDSEVVQASKQGKMRERYLQ